MELTDEQRKVYDAVHERITGETRCTVVAGAAGCGKSFLLTKIAENLPTFAVMAWTGKATNVLRERGIHHAATIHSTIYKPIIIKGQLVGFELRQEDELGCDGFLVDEGSTVSKGLYDDLMSFGLPCIFVGDHKQLEPIDSNFNLMEKPDYVLETIHRNAGDIARFAEKVSRGDAASGYKSDQVTLIEKKHVTNDLLMEVDQIICAYNRTRVELNNRVRDTLGFPEEVVEGDRVICLKNRKKLGLFNGMQGIVQEIDGNRFTLDCDGLTYYQIPFDPNQFGRESAPNSQYMFGPVPFDFAYACTAHKFQGSEADKVLVWVQECKNWDHRRWAYTGASRAKKHLYWAM